MPKSSKYWDKRALQRLIDAEKSTDAYTKRIKKIYNQAYKNIQKEIELAYKNYSKDTGIDVQKLKTLLSKKETDKLWKTLKRQGLDKYVKDNYKSRISRLEQIQAQIYGKAKLIYDKEELEQTMAYKGVINDSYYKAIYDTQMGTGYDFSFNRIDKNLINSLLSERWSGKNYSERIWGNTDILANQISTIIGGALLSGQSIAKTSKQIRDRFNVAKYYSDRLVRTETNYFNNQADALAYKEMGVDKYVFVATLDNRTSLICQEMDNKVFKYKDISVGENYPPLHPNCRSKTRGYLGEEVEKNLIRRARNPITGKNEIIDNISYKEWAKQHGLIKKEPASTTKTVKNSTNKPKNDIINIKDLPTQFSSKSEIKNTEIALDFINNQKNANSKIVKLFKNMGNITKLPFKISHAKDSSFSYARSGKSIKDIKLTIPNLDKNNIGSIQTWLHENMHLLDFMRNNKDANNYQRNFSTSVMNLQTIVRTTDKSMSKEISELFTKYNNEYNTINSNEKNNAIKETEKLNNDFLVSNKGKDISIYSKEYKEYKKKCNEINKQYKESVDVQSRNLMGGGINQLQDIYDALSGGEYRNNGTVIYGHGKNYYQYNDNRIKEIVANYGSLSISRPDLIDMLKRNKPELVNALDSMIDEMLKE